jgi:hypothetical protein
MHTQVISNCTLIAPILIHSLGDLPDLFAFVVRFILLDITSSVGLSA